MKSRPGTTSFRSLLQHSLKYSHPLPIVAIRMLRLLALVAAVSSAECLTVKKAPIMKVHKLHALTTSLAGSMFGRGRGSSC